MSFLFFLPKFIPPLSLVPPSKIFPQPQQQQQQLQLPNIAGLVNLLPLFIILPLLTIPLLTIPLTRSKEGE